MSPSTFTFPRSYTRRFRSSTISSVLPKYHVHSGMYRMAKAMGDVGKPVQLAVLDALYRNPDYGSIRLLVLRSVC
jgi:sn1-specific diacylglycerol lipase